MLINIDGWFGGGKSVLWSLLDGHSEIWVNPVHDFSFSLLISQNEHEEWLKKKSTTVLRKILAKSEYYKFEKLSYDGAIPICFSTDVLMNLAYQFDFYGFDKAFIETINQRDEWTIEQLIDDLYECARLFWEPSSQLNKPTYYGVMSHPKHHVAYEKQQVLCPSMKNILVRRDIKSIIATRTNRKERPNDLQEAKAFRTPLKLILEQNEIGQIYDFYIHYDELVQKHPDNFFIVDFEELVYSPEATMRRVAKFLNLEFEEILGKPTRDRKALEYQGLSFIGTENDKWENLLTEDEVIIIEKSIAHAEKGFHLHGYNFEKSYQLSLGMSLYTNFLDEISGKYKNIALYGYGSMGKMTHKKLGNSVVAIFDQSAGENEFLLPPERLGSVDFDILLITVLGREEKILNTLNNLYCIPEEKIRFFVWR